MSTIFDAVYREVTHVFDLEDLLPVETRMIDTVIEATLNRVCYQLQADADSMGGIHKMSFHSAAHHIRTTMTKQSL